MLSGIYARAENCKGIIAGGIVTQTKDCKGLQLGLVNTTNTMQGLQLGLLNTIRENPRWCRTLPLLNLHLEKYIPRIDSIYTGDTLLVRRYQLDNYTPLSETTVLHTDLHSPICYGHWKSYDSKGRLTSDTVYAADTIVATENIYYSGRYRRISIQNAAFSQWLTIKKQDTISFSLVPKKQMAWHYHDLSRQTWIYNDMTVSPKRYTEIYTGKPLQYGTFRLVKGDTLNSLAIHGAVWDRLPETFMYNYTMLSKKDTALFLNKEHIIAFAYAAKDSSRLYTTEYMNSRHKKIKTTLYADADSCIIKNFYRNGRIRSISVRNKDIFFDKRGQLREVFFSDQYEGYNIRRYRHNRLSEQRTAISRTVYYHNGNKHIEYSNGGDGDASKRIYRKNGTLRKEECFGENENTIYILDRQGLLKRTKQNHHKLPEQNDLEGPQLQ